jgi:hypothetical protein
MVSVIFADTSAVAKRYLVEIGSAWVTGWIEPTANNVILMSELTLVEMQSLLMRRVREGTLAMHDALLLRNDFLLHVQDEYLRVHIDTLIFSLASALVMRHPLRTLDAIQLASAIYAVNILAEPVTFVSGDKNLLIAASLEGFTVDDPNVHP